ncbi:MAG: hypothetical protein AAFX03_09490 [Pseudomonadota bacterium]
MTQNACVAALQGAGASDEARRKADLWKTKRADEEDAEAPSAHLVSLLELLLRVSDEEPLAPPFRYNLAGEDQARFERLMELRNAFLHMPPEGHGVWLNEVPDLLDAAVRAVEHLAVVQPTFAPTGWRAQATALSEDLNHIRDSMAFWRTL